MRRLLVLALGVLGIAALAGAGCGRDDARVELRLFAMGTWVDLSLPRAAAREQGELIAGIEAELQRFGSDYYAWGDGELARLNQALSETGRFDASPLMADVLRAAQQIFAASEGAFDPGVGALVELWGFDQAEAAPEPPTAAAIAQSLEQLGSIGDLDLSRDTIRLAATAEPAGSRRFTLDLGGIAKGEIVDRVVQRLEAAGVAPAIVNAGGDLRVVGEPAARSWRIGVQAPRADGLLGTIRLDAGEAAFSSGDYERYYELDGRRLHHIIDPRTGMPVAHTEAVTVIAADGRTADAAATALFVAGPARWRELARQLGVVAALRVDADGTIGMTAEMRDRFQPAAQTASDIIVGDD